MEKSFLRLIAQAETFGGFDHLVCETIGKLSPGGGQAWAGEFSVYCLV